MIDESIFKAYDIRGTYPDQLDEDLARDIGRAFVNYLGLPGSRVVVARDMRLSGEDLQAAFIAGVTEAGADAPSPGTASTAALSSAGGPPAAWASRGRAGGRRLSRASRRRGPTRSASGWSRPTRCTSPWGTWRSRVG